MGFAFRRLFCLARPGQERRIKVTFTSSFCLLTHRESRFWRCISLYLPFFHKSFSYFIWWLAGCIMQYYMPQVTLDTSRLKEKMALPEDCTRIYAVPPLIVASWTSFAFTLTQWALFQRIVKLSAFLIARNVALVSSHQVFACFPHLNLLFFCPSCCPFLRLDWCWGKREAII